MKKNIIVDEKEPKKLIIDELVDFTITVPNLKIEFSEPPKKETEFCVPINIIENERKRKDNIR